MMSDKLYEDRAHEGERQSGKSSGNERKFDGIRHIPTYYSTKKLLRNNNNNNTLIILQPMDLLLLSH